MTRPNRSMGFAEEIAAWNVDDNAPRAVTINPGDVRRFGPDGVLYEVAGKPKDAWVRIRVLDTGESALYPLAKALADPRV